MTPIYHITEIRNLPSIIKHEGLCSDRLGLELDLEPVGIAHKHIKERRANRSVDKGMGGTLADYVPFYFAPRSPMLYSINGGYVEEYPNGQRPIIHLVSSVETVTTHRLPFVFTDGHAEMRVSEFSDDVRDLQSMVD